MENLKQKELNAIEKIRSFLVAKQVFLFLPTKKMLEIIKFSKRTQDKINISVDNYKKYSEIYSSIEIEVIPVLNKDGKFININNFDEQSSFKIFFNNNRNEEIKRNTISIKDYITKIDIIIDYKVKSFSYLFFGCEIIKSVNFTKFLRINVENMKSMFQDCDLLEKVKISTYIT